MIRKIISGGQKGVDTIALECAATMNIATGGWAPQGWQTLDGPREKFLRGFKLRECQEGYGYARRTRSNVRDSDGTLRIYVDNRTPGEVCTLNAIKYFQKPYFDVDLLNLELLQDEAFCANWILKNKIKVLNVAGNADLKGKESEAKDYLMNLFQRILTP